VRRLVNAGVIVVAGAVATLSAQWAPPYPTGVPRTAGGELNLNAPTPRTPDGKPDLSGVWQNARGPGGAPGGRAGAAPLAVVPADGIALATFGNVGAGFKDGLPLQPWAADVVKKRMADNSKDNPDAHCLPMGFMQFHNHPQLRKIIQTPREVVIVYEANYGLRQIFLDGRRAADDPEPWWYGYSTGRWDGDTLVVQTTGFTDDLWLDVRGDPLSGAAKVTERFRRVNAGNLDIEITVDDPKTYTRPWTVKIAQRLADAELNEFICEDRDASHYVAGTGK
jgi:hypothetical protein